MGNHIIEMNTDLCVGCGLCAQDCPARNIDIADKKATVRDQGCMKCGHCVAICPYGAVSITGFDAPPAEIDGPTLLKPQQLLEAIKTRRSVRKFADKEIPSEILRQVIEAGRFTPSAKNAQNISYIVLQEQRNALEKIAVDFSRRLLPVARLFIKEGKHVMVDDHFFFKKAPAAIVIVSDGSFGQVNGALAASNMALMAEANSLGVLYSGFFTIAANHSRKLRRALQLRRGQKAVTTLVLGYPDVRYHRTAQRESAEASWL